MSPDREVLDELVRRIVAAVKPLRIILFGSAARGEMGPNSDLDVLVVMPDGCDCLSIAQYLYMRMDRIPYALDILVVQQQDVDLWGNNPYLILYTAMTEGKELYRAAS
jgi:predicted nucleotidyltransferase